MPTDLDEITAGKMIATALRESNFEEDADRIDSLMDMFWTTYSEFIAELRHALRSVPRERLRQLPDTVQKLAKDLDKQMSSKFQ